MVKYTIDGATTRVNPLNKYEFGPTVTMLIAEAVHFFQYRELSFLKEYTDEGVYVEIRKEWLQGQQADIYFWKVFEAAEDPKEDILIASGNIIGKGQRFENIISAIDEYNYSTMQKRRIVEDLEERERIAERAIYSLDIGGCDE